MASSGFIQGVGSPRMTPSSGNTARKYKSKSEYTKARPQTPTLNAGKYKFVDLVLVTST
jgi:transcription factor E2F3